MKTILVAIDFSDVATDVISRSVELAKALLCSLHLVHVADPNPFFVGNEVEPQIFSIQREEELNREKTELEAIASQISDQGVEVSAELLFGVPIATIIDKAEELDACYIVIGKKDHGFFYRTFMGSTSEGVVSKASCPVVVIPVKSEE